MPRVKVGNMTAAIRPAGNRFLDGGFSWAPRVIAIGVLVAAILLSLNWPFTQAAVTKALQDRFVAGRLRSAISARHYFPPGCVAEGVEFLHRRRKDLPPLITVQRLTIRTSYSELLRIHQTVNDIRVDGLHVLIPRKARKTEPSRYSRSPIALPEKMWTSAKSPPTMRYWSLCLKNQDKNILSSGSIILALDHVSENDPVTFHARFKNTQPPGEILSDGQFGPWNEDDPGSTRVSGSYVYQHVNLGVFEGVSRHSLLAREITPARLAISRRMARSMFPISRYPTAAIRCILLPSFTRRSTAPTEIPSLTRVESHFRKTTLVTQGDVKGHPGGHGKTASLTFSVDQGRVEDLLWMFSHSAASGRNWQRAVACESGIATRASFVLAAASIRW